MIYRRGQDKQWFLYILEDKTDILTLNTLELELCLDDIYGGVI
ncbi:MAG: hypothetical protein WBM32_17965 [Crocosphaera sp.]|jgi:hypothetical protein